MIHDAKAIIHDIIVMIRDAGVVIVDRWYIMSLILRGIQTRSG